MSYRQLDISRVWDIDGWSCTKYHSSGKLKRENCVENRGKALRQAAEK